MRMFNSRNLWMIFQQLIATVTFHQDLRIGDPEGVFWQFGTCQAALANRRMTTVLHLYPVPLSSISHYQSIMDCLGLNFKVVLNKGILQITSAKRWGRGGHKKEPTCHSSTETISDEKVSKSCNALHLALVRTAQNPQVLEGKW